MKKWVLGVILRFFADISTIIKGFIGSGKIYGVYVTYVSICQCEKI